MGIGYAAFNTELKISGTSKVTSNWDIEITNVTPGTPTGSAENTVAPKWDALTASMEADLYEKGDAMEYDVTIENKGTIDAKLNDVLTNIENSNSEAVNITFSGYTKGEILKSKSVKVIHVKIEYNPNYDGEETSSEVEIKFDYGQNNDETSPPENTHLITYDCITNGGNDCSNNNEYLVTGSSVDLTKKGTKDNYDFVGWNTDKDSAEALTELTVGDTDITLYAIFKAKDTTPPIIDNISTSTTSNSITVVVAAHDDESGISKYEFSINDGNYIDNGNNNVYTFTNLKSDTNYNIKVRVTNGTELTAEDQVGSGIDITDDVTTTGDGLYEDAYEEGRYVYRGQNPNNYITFNGETWRIIAKETDGTYKIIRNEVLEKRPFDNQNRTASSTYCADTSSCGVYAAVDGTFSSPSGSQSGTVTEDSSIKIYLNDDYYVNNLNSTAKGQMTAHSFNIGAVERLDQSGAEADSIEKNIAGEKMYQWTGNVGLANVSDILRASTNPLCTSATTSYDGTNECNSNYLLNRGTASELYYWTINASSCESGGNSSDAWIGYAGGSRARLGRGVAYSSYFAPRPVVFLKSDIALSGIGTKESPFEIIDGISLPELEKPIFTETGALPTTVTITYPDGCGDNLTCTYQKDNGEEVNVTTKTVDVEFNDNGTLLAKASDGTNTVISSYEIKVGIDITENITSSGDGLYEDSTEESRYIYKGENPNNYIEFNNELWKIISKETDGTMKIVKNGNLDARAFDNANNRSSTYCNNSANGCNTWGSSTTTYNGDGDQIDAISDSYTNNVTYALPSKEASLNTYLNTTYYNSLSEIAQSQIDTHFFNIGTVDSIQGNTLKQDRAQEEKYKWLGKIGLLNVTDYISSTTNTKCTNIYNYDNNINCYRNSLTTNWISKIIEKTPRFINGQSGTRTNVWGMNHESHNIGSNGLAANSNFKVLPTLYIKSDVKIISGEGTNSNPYILDDTTKYIPTFKESETNLKTVTITYPDGCGDNLTCTYQKDNGAKINVTSGKVEVVFDNDGSLVATVSDGVNTASSSYTMLK